MLRLSFALVLALSFSSLGAQTSYNMVSLGNWHDPDLELSRVRYNDVWGYAANGREYALLGSRGFVHVLDITDPTNITEIARLNDVTGSSSIWRDIKVHGDYAYMVTEAAEGLQVIDLTDLPNSASVIYQTTAEFSTCHNIFIDESVSPAKLYAFGTNTGAQRDGYIVYSLADPEEPTLL
ncbi:MAG: choice-of-anchor B family protein, partial [Bacteroidota bacterium]